MSGNGPIGHPARPPVRRPLADDPFTTPPTGQPQQPHWPPRYAEPPAQHGHPPAYPATRLSAPGSAPAAAYGAQEAHGQQPAPGYYFPQAAAEPQGYAPPTSGHQLPFGSPAHAPAPSMRRRCRGGPIRRATISATICRRRHRAIRRPRPIRSSKRTIRLRCSSMITIPPTSAPRSRATPKPTPTSTRCWPRRRSSRAAAAAA